MQCQVINSQPTGPRGCGVVVAAHGGNDWGDQREWAEYNEMQVGIMDHGMASDNGNLLACIGIGIWCCYRYWICGYRFDIGVGNGKMSLICGCNRNCIGSRRGMDMVGRKVWLANAKLCWQAWPWQVSQPTTRCEYGNLKCLERRIETSSWVNHHPQCHSLQICKVAIQQCVGSRVRFQNISNTTGSQCLTSCRRKTTQ